MRNVILSMNVTLDGLIEGSDGDLEWTRVDDELWGYVNETLETVDTVLFGRVTYQGFAEYWPAAAANPSSPQPEMAFGRWIDNTPKIVFSKTLEKVEWKNSRLVKGDIAEEIASLKKQPGKDMVMFGGAAIAAAFMTAGLIDDYRITVFPVVLGEGKPLFEEVMGRTNLRLVSAKTFKSGAVGLRYRKTEGS